MLLSEENGKQITGVLEALALYTGETNYDSDNDRTFYNCPFCPNWWERVEHQDWWTDEIKSEHMDVHLEKHIESCPVYIARTLLGIKPNADPVTCPICGKKNWNNRSGWNGSQAEFDLYWDGFRRPGREARDRTIKSGCCAECEAQSDLFRTNRFNRQNEARRQELAQPGQREKERESYRASLQAHFDGQGIKLIVELDENSGGLRSVPVPPTI
jgi:hypothetical protein